MQCESLFTSVYYTSMSVDESVSPHILVAKVIEHPSITLLILLYSIHSTSSLLHSHLPWVHWLLLHHHLLLHHDALFLRRRRFDHSVAIPSQDKAGRRQFPHVNGSRGVHDIAVVRGQRGMEARVADGEGCTAAAVGERRCRGASAVP